MKLIKSIVLSVVMLGFPFMLASAQSHLNVLAANDGYDNDENDNSDSDQDDAAYDANYQKYASHSVQHVQTNGHSVFVFDPNRLRWYAYDSSGDLVGSGRASGGRNYCPDTNRRCKTPIGIYHVNAFGGAGCVSSKFPIGKGGAPMPYCMFFHGGFAIHGSNEIPNYNASHGCIRIEPAAARWLQENVIDYGTTVIVKPY
jgi:lipoprotein-anchoring transpeptidase ErfK/SrfK